jgi:hypothetical protein
MQKQISNFLKSKKVNEVLELHEFPNKYGNNVSNFSVRYNVQDKYNYDKVEIKIEYSTSRLFISNKGYFSFETIEDVYTIIDKQTNI